MIGTPFAMRGIGGFFHAPWIKKFGFYRTAFDLPFDNDGGWIIVPKVMATVANRFKGGEKVAVTYFYDHYKHTYKVDERRYYFDQLFCTSDYGSRR